MPFHRTNSADPIRRVPLSGVSFGDVIPFDLDFVSPVAVSSVRLACSSAWLEVTLDGGTTWTALGTDPRSGVDLGSMLEGERKTINLRLVAPTTGNYRTENLVLKMGLG